MFCSLSTVLTTLSLVSLVSAHGLVTAVQGANGITTPGFANVATTPRNTGSPRTAEGDTSVIRDDTCGKTKDAGAVNIASELNAIETWTGVPSAGANGQVSATIHQVNQDGAGPYTFEVSPSAAGGDWVTMTVQQNVPGEFLGLSTAVAQDFSVQATIPAGTKCTGGTDGQTCVIRAKNKALAGPFGSCFAVTQAQGGTAAAGTASGAAEALKVKRRMGVYSNALVRRVEGIAVSWERFVAKKV